MPYAWDQIIPSFRKLQNRDIGRRSHAFGLVQKFLGIAVQPV
jgi:hypothetical protein